MAINFNGINRRLLSMSKSLVGQWLPGGKFEGVEYVCLNPRREDRNIGSFKINTMNGKWSDFADECDGAKGGDLISLYAYIKGLSQGAAARKLQRMIGG